MKQEYAKNKDKISQQRRQNRAKKQLVNPQPARTQKLCKIRYVEYSLNNWSTHIKSKKHHHNYIQEHCGFGLYTSLKAIDVQGKETVMHLI